MIKGAKISNCKKHRYQLWRLWDDSLPKLLFIMLNPSTADAEKDDPTIRRCIGFAKSWGFGGIYVGNLYSYRTSSPKILIEKLEDVSSKINLDHLLDMEAQTDKTIYAWGNKRGIPSFIHHHTRDAFYIDMAKDGTPKHPLYLKGCLTPKPIQHHHIFNCALS